MQVVSAARELGLKHIVITSVTRDDLSDGGSGHFAETISAIRKGIPQATIEVLTPDFQGDADAVRLVAEAGPDIFNHNLETVPRMYPRVRSLASYKRSLDLFLILGSYRPDFITKSGIMVGLGERADEVIFVLQDLKAAGCDIVTIGQYLRPRKSNFPVAEYVPEAQFAEYERIGYDLGFRMVVSAPLVRSSFRADEAIRVLGRHKANERLCLGES
jgi:lipoic acid synthetase